MSIRTESITHLLRRNFGEEPAIIKRAAMIANVAHHGQTRISGGPYFEHLEAVAANPDFDDTHKAVAFLHDVIQKTEVTAENLRDWGMPDEVVDEVVDLTPEGFGEPYFDRIEIINRRPIARAVKIADNQDNMDEDRMPEGYKPSLKMAFNWSFQYPLSIAFMSATAEGTIPDTSRIVDFIVSEFCPQKLRTPERLKEWNSTSHPIPGQQ